MSEKRANPSDPPTRSAKSESVGTEVAEWLRDLRGQWLKPIEKPLSKTKRFFFGFAGSLTFFGYVVPTTGMMESNRIVVYGFDAIQDLLPYVFVLLPSLWFGYLVSWSESRFGPIRIYLAGLILPTIVSLLTMRAHG